MPAYLIATIHVTDPALFARYRELVPAIISRFGGRYLVRGGEQHVVEGDAFAERVTVLEFDDLAAARTFYDSEAYAPVRQLRLDSTRSSVVLVAGVA